MNKQPKDQTVEFFGIIGRQWPKILLFFVVSFCTVVGGLYLVAETYESSAKLLIKVGRENAAVPTVLPTSQQLVASMGVRKEDINSEIEILRSRVIIEKTVNKLGTDFLFPKDVRPTSFFKVLKFEAKRIYREIKDSLDEVLIMANLKKRLSVHEKALLILEKSVSAKQVANSDVIDLKVRWFAPNIAATLLTTLLDYYMEMHLVAHRPEGGFQVLQNQVIELDGKLRSTEQELKTLKLTQGITSFEEQRSLLLRQLSAYQVALQEVETEISETGRKSTELKSQKASLLKTISPGSNVVINEVEREILQHQTRASGLAGKKEMIEKHVLNFQSELAKLDSYEVELKRLNRQIAVTEDSYQLYRKKLEEARITNVLDVERIVNVKIIEPATVPILPVKPKKMMILGIGAVMSLLGGLCLAFLTDKPSMTATDEAVSAQDDATEVSAV